MAWTTALTLIIGLPSLPMMIFPIEECISGGAAGGGRR
jgi:hypothetical protein